MKLYTLVLTVLFAVMIGQIGCAKSRQKMDTPKINMITPENIHGVIAPDDEHIWITGNYGVIFHSADGGASWVQQESGVKESILVDGVFLDARTGWVVGINGTILHTGDGGSTWVKQQTGTKRHLFGIAFADRLNGWAVGEWSTILHTADGGLTWTPQAEEADRLYNNVCFVDRQTGWIVGERGTVLHTRDGGVTWEEQMPKDFERHSFEDELLRPRPTLFSVFFIDRQRGWFCGIDATIGRTVDGGATWELLPTGIDFTLYTIHIAGGKGYSVGDKGAYLESPDGGLTWELKTDVIKSKLPFRDVCFSSPSMGWVVGKSGTVVHTADAGASWEFFSGLSYVMDFFSMPKALEFGGGTE